MKEEEKENIQLPENAFRELKEGEEFEPIMHQRRASDDFLICLFVVHERLFFHYNHQRRRKVYDRADPRGISVMHRMHRIVPIFLLFSCLLS